MQLNKQIEDLCLTITRTFQTLSEANNAFADTMRRLRSKIAAETDKNLLWSTAGLSYFMDRLDELDTDVDELTQMTFDAKCLFERLLTTAPNEIAPFEEIVDLLNRISKRQLRHVLGPALLLDNAHEILVEGKTLGEVGESRWVRPVRGGKRWDPP